MPLLKLTDVDLHFVQNGSGPDLVWIPGGDGTIADYEEQYPYFANGFRQTAFDPRGAGKTVIHKLPPWAIADMAADCAQLIRAVCEPPVIVLGLSMGGLISQQVAIDYPDLVKAAIPMGTCAKATGYCRDFMVAEVEFRRKGGKLSPDLTATHFAALSYPANLLGDDDQWARVREGLLASYKDREDEFLIAQWQACIDFDCIDGLRGCPVPIHVIAFSEDMQTPPAFGKRVADLAPKGHYLELPGMGHCSMLGHRAGALNEAVRSILELYQ